MSRRIAALLILLGGLAGPAARAAEPAVAQEAAGRYAAEVSRMLGVRVQQTLGFVREGAGTVKVRFTLNRAGHLVAAGIEQSSGQPSYDMRILGILLLSAPFPPLPAEMPDAQITFVAPIEIHSRAALP
jgi:periplasmic protein TonB